MFSVIKQTRVMAQTVTIVARALKLTLFGSCSKQFCERNDLIVNRNTINQTTTKNQLLNLYVKEEGVLNYEPPFLLNGSDLAN